jgi:hypothetical protein
MRSIEAIANLGNVRTMNTVGARSIPKVQRSVYLDLYVLKKEKDRLESEMFLLDKRRKVAGQLLADINRRIDALQGEIRSLPETRTGQQAKRDGLRTMPVTY